jgi:transcriptional regulator with XRE-family HTH domain
MDPCTVRRAPSIWNLERGRNFPSVETLHSLSEHLAIPVREFFEEDKRSLDQRTRLELKAPGVLHSLTDEFLEIAVEQLGVLAKRGGRLEP